MATIDEYLQTWKLKLSTTKKVSAVFHFNSKEAKHELKVDHKDETLLFCSEPKYLGAVVLNPFSPKCNTFFAIFEKFAAQ